MQAQMTRVSAEALKDLPTQVRRRIDPADVWVPEGYEVELVPAQGERRVMPAAQAQLQVALAAGTYRWSVRALGRDGRSESSSERNFEVAEEPVKPPKRTKIKVKTSPWK